MRFFIRVVLLNTLFLFIAFNSKSQSFGIVKDSLTQEPIPFVNIWVEDEFIGTTSNEKGEIQFKKSVRGKNLIFSSIGYRTKTIRSEKDNEIYFLKQEVIQLKEVVVKRQKGKTNSSGEKIKLSNVRQFFICDGNPYMKAKYFRYSEDFDKTPFISKIELVTNSPINNSTFNLRLYTMNEKGGPDKSLYNENIIVTTKKGKNITTVDLTDKVIEFPKTGVLVAAEFLIVEQNHYPFTYTMPPDTVTLKAINYVPGFGAVPVESGENCWVYDKGQWKKSEKNKGLRSKEYEGKYSELAMRMTLTN